MAIRKWYGAFVVGGLVGLIAAGCSSSDTTTASDGGDAGTRRMLDASPGGGGDDAADSGSFDGTTGKPCTSDSDCVTATGPGINTCSSDYGFSITDVTVALWATPVCIVTPPQSAGEGNCDPAPQGNDGLPHFCDGPDDPTSPGLCVPFDVNNPQPGQGVCYPLCTFAIDGSKATGCAGTDTCFPVTFLRSTSAGTVTGYGFCGGGCQQDSDCTPLGAGFVCQTDIGYCTQKKVTRTKAIGTACTVSLTGAADDVTTGACNCDSDPMTGQGFCSSSCVVGGLPCPGGWTCDAGFPNPLTFTSSTGTTITVPLTAQNIGTPGVCRPACTLADAGVVDSGAAPGADGGDDAGSDAAATPIVLDGGVGGCPVNATCQNVDLAGPDCVP
jgi:hypothetical protein